MQTTCSPTVRGLAIVALLCVLPAGLAAQRGMTIVDLIEVPSLGDPQLSPDGRHVLFVRSEADWEDNRTRGHVWRIGADGSEAMQLTRGEGEGSPRWSPDGRWIAFVAERGDDEDGQIYLLDTRGGEARRLTDHDASVGSIAWSSDGRWLYFTAQEPKTAEQKEREDARDDVFAYDEDWRHRHLWRADAASGATERLTEGDYSVLDFSLSGDGAMVALVRAPTPILDDLRQREVHVMAARPGAEMRRVTSNDVPESNPRLSPDNRQVLFLADSNEDFDSYYNDKIFLAPVEGGAARVLLPDLPHEVNGAEWSRDGRAILFRANTGVRQDLFRVGVADRRVRRLTEGDHAVGSWMYEPRQGRIVFTLETPTNRGDVWTIAADGGRPRQVTNVYAYLQRDFRLPRVEAVTWPGEDGVRVEGLLWYPLDYAEGRRYPLVVQTHGGPAASDKFAFPGSSDYVQKLADLGYFVFQPNYRGSTGYGDPFLRDMVPGYFNQAHKDVMTGVDYLIARGLVDGERMAKMGWSGGGHMTNKIITYTDRFKAASSGAGAANWVSMYGQSDVRFYRTPWFGGTPWQEDAPIEMYWDHSPLKDVWKVRTPTIFLVGQEDVRVPMPQSVEMFRALRANGVPTHLYVAPREPHGWRELRHRLYKANVELDWFERWVMGREYVWETAPEAEKAAATAAAGG
ncbi:MAG TPA: S9 family peptidase [Longimicrobiales bacterium]|nr:S9 family peptidase [Longimicrobiales bacterium]